MSTSCHAYAWGTARIWMWCTYRWYLVAGFAVVRGIVHMWGVTHSHMRRESIDVAFVCRTWRIRTCHVTRTSAPYPTYECAYEWAISKIWMTRAPRCFICGIDLIVSHIPHINVWVSHTPQIYWSSVFHVEHAASYMGYRELCPTYLCMSELYPTNIMKQRVLRVKALCAHI